MKNIYILSLCDVYKTTASQRKELVTTSKTKVIKELKRLEKRQAIEIELSD